ncbi:hypothetical protein TNCV_103911 [Trichonephila clavipes]|nr:hypothetical protein TNCV_103911 [Trichonephila clavipes]
MYRSRSTPRSCPVYVGKDDLSLFPLSPKKTEADCVSSLPVWPLTPILACALRNSHRRIAQSSPFNPISSAAGGNGLSVADKQCGEETHFSIVPMDVKDNSALAMVSLSNQSK